VVERGQPGTQPRHVALVDAQLTAEVALRQLAALAQHQERVGVGHRQRLPARRGVAGEHAEPPEHLLHRAAQLVGGIGRHGPGLPPDSCARNQSSAAGTIERALAGLGYTSPSAIPMCTSIVTSSTIENGMWTRFQALSSALLRGASTLRRS
jgi:hypothetical protein